ncbi:K02A2.6-like [Cordylochernes scorpioides]|uniref:K02A2.6-like n=1 Tax=Cordylochernes scorpioides TaxID=51811 RepID=A0ABY6JYC8_9ARAC|nr:K02A2.6-like [Cordylochernes scorpioides]
MPFGLCNAPATFERIMDNVLHNLRWKMCLCYLDDVIIYSRDFPSHLMRIEAKCRFAFEEIEILDHVANQYGIKPAEHNIRAVRDFPGPRKTKKIQSFIGLFLYYRKAIRDFAKIADPLIKLTRKDVPFIWTKPQEEAFRTLKSRARSNSGKKYSTTEKECLAVVWSMTKLRPYLYGRHFKVRQGADRYWNTLNTLTVRLGYHMNERESTGLSPFGFHRIERVDRMTQQGGGGEACPERSKKKRKMEEKPENPNDKAEDDPARQLCDKYSTFGLTMQLFMQHAEVTQQKLQAQHRASPRQKDDNQRSSFLTELSSKPPKYYLKFTT